MRRKLFASLALIAAGSSASAQGLTPPQPMPQAMPGMYNGPLVPTQGMEAPPQAMAGHPGAMAPMPGPMGGGMGPMGGMGGDPAAGLMGAPSYPPPGFQGFDPYAGNGGGGGNSSVPHFWLNTDAFLWYLQSVPTRQPYITTSSPGDFGVPGAPTTYTLYARDNIGYANFAGFRIMGGWYKDADKRCGFEFGGFLSEQQHEIFRVVSDSNGIPTISRPFTDAVSGAPGVFTVANLGLASGGAAVNTGARFWGAEGSFINNLYRSCPDAACFWNIDALAGIRYFELKESMNFDSSSTILAGGASFVGSPVAIGGRIDINDSFNTLNQFYGGQVGLRSNVNYGRCTIGMAGKVAFGLMHQQVDIAGSTRLVDPALGLNAVATGGVYANSQNIGRYENDEFSLIPEVTLSLGYQWCSWFSTSIGYNAMYITNVVRPGSILPTAVNSSLLPASNNYGLGPVVPVVNNSLSQSDVWIQGVQFSFTAKW